MNRGYTVKLVIDYVPEAFILEYDLIHYALSSASSQHVTLSQQ